MGPRTRLAASAVALFAACSVLLSARDPLNGSAAAVQLQLADLLFSHADYRHALGVYRSVAEAGDRVLSTRGRMGSVRSALRLAEYDLAAIHAAALRAAAPADPAALSLSGDALWASGLFDEAEAAYRAALDRDPAGARARHGIAKSLASRNRLEEALDEAQASLRAAPDDPEIHGTVAQIEERLGRYAAAASAYEAYLSNLSPGDRQGKAGWMRTEVRLLRSFGNRRPFEIELPEGSVRQTVPFRLVKGKVVIPVKVNGAEWTDFSLDTGAEQTVVSAKLANRLGIDPMGETMCAGVGFIGIRGVQVSKIDSLQIGSLKVRHVQCLIKTPPLKGLPMGEVESLSPLAMGLSVAIDYKARRVTFGHLDPGPPAAFELPFRLQRLATVRGTANGNPSSFIVDTGGEVLSLSRDTADTLFMPADRSRIRLRVYGTSGWDPDAYLLPGVQVAFDRIVMPMQSMVVLNLRAPSILLGYQLGGIIGHRFLSKYQVEIDLARSVVRLREPS